MRTLFFLLTWIVLTTRAYGQVTFANTIPFADGATAPNADLNSLRWLEGHWKGEALGGITEEVWSRPLGGSMMCAFKLVVEDKVKFYELATLSEENGTLVLRLKHFRADLKGWEDKDQTIDFRLVKVTSNKIFFDEFTIERVSGSRMNIYVVIEQGGKREEVKFSYEKNN